MTGAADQSDVALPKRRANRPVTFLHRLEYAGAIGLMGFFRLIGVDASSWIAGKFMRFVGPLLRSVSRRAEINLIAIHPDWPTSKVCSVVRDVWENLGRTTAEFAHLQKFSIASSGRIRVEGADHVATLAAQPAPVLFVSGHFANWEIGAICLNQLGLDFAIVYRAANNPLIDEMIIQARARTMTRRQIPKAKQGGRGLVDALRQKVPVALLVDQKFNTGISVAFLGREAMTATAPARLALKFNAPIHPISIERRNGAHFIVTIHDAIRFTPAGDTDADIRALTERINHQIERDIEKNPGQWLWLHRRWPKPE